MARELRYWPSRVFVVVHRIADDPNAVKESTRVQLRSSVHR